MLFYTNFDIGVLQLCQRIPHFGGNRLLLLTKNAIMKRCQKSGQGQPSFGKNPKEQQLFFGMPSLTWSIFQVIFGISISHHKWKLWGLSIRASHVDSSHKRTRALAYAHIHRKPHGREVAKNGLFTVTADRKGTVSGIDLDTILKTSYQVISFTLVRVKDKRKSLLYHCCFGCSWGFEDLHCQIVFNTFLGF